MIEPLIINAFLVGIFLLLSLELIRFLYLLRRKEHTLAATEIKLYHDTTCKRCGRALQVERKYLKHTAKTINCKNCRAALAFGATLFKRFNFLCLAIILTFDARQKAFSDVAAFINKPPEEITPPPTVTGRS